jgi:thiol-disulfide isomerase/thioredoxin
LISSPDNDIDDFIPKISSIDNISPIKTLNDLQKSVEKNDKPVSIVLFYGQYCPYSKRTIPELRQWARANQDRIFLYEVDVEQASNLAEYYHIRSIPTIMAFEENNLIVPIWQRTATNVLPSNESESIEDEFDDSNNLYTIRDPPVQKSVSINDIKQDQDEENTIDQCLFLFFRNNKKKSFCLAHSFDNIRSKSFTSSVQSPYIWNKSTSSMEITSQKSLEESFSEYNGRMISQSTISKTESKSFSNLISSNNISI